MTKKSVQNFIISHLTKKSKMSIFISMNRKIIVVSLLMIIAIVLGFFYGCTCKKQTSSETIDEQFFQEAIQYGKSKAGIPTYEFMEPWSIYLGYEVGKGRAVYLSPFLQIAQLAKNAEEKKLKPDINIIKKAVTSKLNTLNFLITTYGNEPDTSRRIKAYLLFNNIRIEPVYAHFPPYGEFNRDYYQQINGEVRFLSKDIPRNATVKLCIEILPQKEKRKHHDHHDHESEIVVGEVVPEHILTEFVFDLSKYK